MSLSIKADSDIVLRKTSSMVQFKQYYRLLETHYKATYIQNKFSVNTDIRCYFFAKITRL